MVLLLDTLIQLCSPLNIIIVALIITKLYLKLTIGFYKGKRRLDGKTVIVTGSNTGIGKEAAKDFAQRGARVILACRDKTSANEARAEIVAASGNHDVVVRELDLASLASVRAFARDVINTEPRLDVLVNNAGAGGLGIKKSVDGLQLVMQINYFAPFLLTNLLVDLMKKSSPSRIIFVSSLAHRPVKLNLEDLNFETSNNEFKLYGWTKLANILNANELARRLEGTGVTVNSLNPGGVATGIFRNTVKILRIPINFGLNYFYKTPHEGAQTTIYLAVSEKVANVTGKYFEDCKEVLPSKAAQDMEVATKLWEKTEELINTSTETKIE